MKHRDESGKEYIIINDELVGAMFYFSLVLAVAVTVLALALTKLP